MRVLLNPVAKRLTFDACHTKESNSELIAHWAGLISGWILKSLRYCTATLQLCKMWWLGWHMKIISHSNKMRFFWSVIFGYLSQCYVFLWRMNHSFSSLDFLAIHFFFRFSVFLLLASVFGCNFICASHVFCVTDHELWIGALNHEILNLVIVSQPSMSFALGLSFSFVFQESARWNCKIGRASCRERV